MTAAIKYHHPYPEHPLRAQLVLPKMQGDEYRELVDPIREHRQQVPIVLHERMVLDGEARQRACIDLGI